MLERYLALTKRRIDELERHIGQQREIVAGLDARRATGEGRQIGHFLLGTLELNLGRQINREKQLTTLLRR